MIELTLLTHDKLDKSLGPQRVGNPKLKTWAEAVKGPATAKTTGTRKEESAERKKAAPTQ